MGQTPGILLQRTAYSTAPGRGSVPPKAHIPWQNWWFVIFIRLRNYLGEGLQLFHSSVPWLRWNQPGLGSSRSLSCPSWFYKFVQLVWEHWEKNPQIRLPGFPVSGHLILDFKHSSLQKIFSKLSVNKTLFLLPRRVFLRFHSSNFYEQYLHGLLHCLKMQPKKRPILEVSLNFLSRWFLT